MKNGTNFLSSILLVLGIGLIIYAMLMPVLGVSFTKSKKDIIKAQNEQLEKLKEALITERQRKMEYSYFEGQKDYMEGNIKIEQVNDTTWKWIDSPWDDGRKAIYDPNKKK